MSPVAVERVRQFEKITLACPQVPILTLHQIHGGMYHRTITIPAGVVLTGALIKRATTLVISGEVDVHTGTELRRLTGYNVIPASAHRKQVFRALTDTHMTMCFPTNARTVEEAEAEFTDETETLFSRRGENIVHITRE